MSRSPQQLAAAAKARGIRREVEVLDTVTRFWEYPAQTAWANGQNPTLLMIHGFRGNHHGLEAIAGALEDFNVLIPDLPGFGESTPFAAEHTVAAYADWLAALVAKLELGHKTHLLGHSFGSIIVSHAVANGLPVLTLTLENPVSAPALKGPKVVQTKIANGFYSATEKMSPARAENALKSWPMVRGMSIIMAKTRDRALRGWIHRQHDENFNDFSDRRTVLEAYRASTSECVGDWVEAFQVPTLAIIGSKDDITSPRQQRSVFARLRVPNRIVEHAGVGHLTHYEIPSEVADDIRLFIAGLESTREGGAHGS